MRKKVKSLAMWVICIAMASCNFEDLETDKITDTEISPNLALKIGSATYSISELLEEIDSEEIEINTDQPLIHLIFEEEISFSDIGSLIEIETVSNTSRYEVPVDVPALGIEQTVPFSTTFSFEFAGEDGETIDLIVFGGGELIYDMTSSFPAGVNYDWTILNTRIISSGENLSQSASLEYTGTTVTDAYSRPLLGLEAELDRVGDLNQFNVELNGDFILDGSNGLSTSQSLDFELIYRDPTFSEVHGDFGNKTIELESNSFDMSSISEYAAEGLFLAEPSITLAVESSFGVDVLLIYEDIEGTFEDGSSISLVHDIDDADRLILGADEVGEAAMSELIINSENSNLAEIFNAFPDNLNFSLSGEINPAISTLESNFIAEDSQIDVVATVDIPLSLRLDDFEVEFEFEIDDMEDVEDMESAELRVITTNGLPLGGDIALTILDEFGEDLLEIGDVLSIGVPDVDSDGIVIEETTTVSGIELTREEIDVLLEGSSIRAVASISTSDIESVSNVKLLSSYELTMELSLRGEVIFEL